MKSHPEQEGERRPGPVRANLLGRTRARSAGAPPRTARSSLARTGGGRAATGWRPSCRRAPAARRARYHPRCGCRPGCRATRRASGPGPGPPRPAPTGPWQSVAMGLPATSKASHQHLRLVALAQEVRIDEATGDEERVVVDGADLVDGAVHPQLDARGEEVDSSDAAAVERDDVHHRALTEQVPQRPGHLDLLEAVRRQDRHPESLESSACHASRVCTPGEESKGAAARRRTGCPWGRAQTGSSARCSVSTPARMAAGRMPRTRTPVAPRR